MASKIRDAWTGMSDRKLYEIFLTSTGGEQVNALTEMARRIGTYKAMTTDKYRYEKGFADSVDRDTVYVFRKYRLGEM